MDEESHPAQPSVVPEPSVTRSTAIPTLTSAAPIVLASSQQQQQSSQLQSSGSTLAAAGSSSRQVSSGGGKRASVEEQQQASTSGAGGDGGSSEPATTASVPVKIQPIVWGSSASEHYIELLVMYIQVISRGLPPAMTVIICLCLTYYSLSWC